MYPTKIGVVTIYVFIWVSQTMELICKNTFSFVHLVTFVLLHFIFENFYYCSPIFLKIDLTFNFDKYLRAQ